MQHCLPSYSQSGAPLLTTPGMPVFVIRWKFPGLGSDTKNRSQSLTTRRLWLALVHSAHRRNGCSSMRASGVSFIKVLAREIKCQSFRTFDSSCTKILTDSKNAQGFLFANRKFNPFGLVSCRKKLWISILVQIHENHQIGQYRNGQKKSWYDHVF